jgi:hypothetical protein
MLALLFSVALAAPIPVGAHVVVGPGATISIPSRGWSAKVAGDAIGWSAVVTSDAGGDTLVVQPELGCGGQLSNRVILDYTVSRDALLPVLAAEARGTSPDGSAWTIGVGAPILSPGVVGFATMGGGMALPLPSIQSAPFVVGALGAHPPAGAMLVSTDAVFRAAPIALHGATGAEVGDDRLTVNGRCGVLTVIEPRIVPPTGAVASAPGGDAPGDGAVQLGGNKLLWPDGGTAGGLLAPMWIRHPKEGGEGITCGGIRVSPWVDAELEVCGTARPSVAPGSESGSVGVGGLIGVSGVSFGSGLGGGPAGSGFGAEPSGPRPTMTLTTPKVTGGMEVALVEAVVRRKISQLKYCYQRELQHDPTLAGVVTVRFNIQGDGVVAEVTRKANTFPNDAVATCVLDRFKQMTFPAPAEGGPVSVTYSLTYAMTP